VAASVAGTSLNITTQWQQSTSSTPAAVTVVDAKGHRVQTNVTVLGRGQSGSIPAILPASIIVSDCTTNVPFVFFGGTPPFSVYSGDSVHVPVSAALPFGANSYFTASVRDLPLSFFAISDTFSATLTVLDSQSKMATAQVLVPRSSVQTCPNNPNLEVVAGSTVAKETEQISFQITGSAPPYTVSANNYQAPNDPHACSALVVSVPSTEINSLDSKGQYSFIATAAQRVPELHDGSAPTCTAMITVTGSDKQQKNVVLTVYPQPTP
jgi:VCBS repeat-containing protein